MELYKANKQWATRPADERFPTVQALYDATKSYADTAKEAVVPYGDLRTEAIDGDVRLTGRSNVPAKLTHWSFGQLAARIAAPANYLRGLPATLAVQNLNHGLAKRIDADGEQSRDAQILFHTNGGGLIARAITSEIYSRIWNYEIAQRLLDLVARGWEPAVPDFTWSPEQAGVTALYASDHDMFGFIRNKNMTIEDPHPGRKAPIYRGLIAENSEVGDRRLVLTRFSYDSMCGNHIIWGASQVVELAIRHVGNVREQFTKWEAEIRKYADESPSDEEAKIARARKTLIAGTKEEVLDKLFADRRLGVSRKTLEASYDAVNTEQDGDPNTAWGFAAGMTRFSQKTAYADERNRLDRAAGKILERIAF